LEKKKTRIEENLSNPFADNEAANRTSKIKFPMIVDEMLSSRASQKNENASIMSLSTRESNIMSYQTSFNEKFVKDFSNQSNAIDNFLHIKSRTKHVSEKNNRSLNPSLTRKLSMISLRKTIRNKESINIIIASKISTLRNRNKLIKDKKSAHFLFILVFTFFVCWVRIILKIPDIHIY
jgi:hypothetical protein